MRRFHVTFVVGAVVAGSLWSIVRGEEGDDATNSSALSDLGAAEAKSRADAISSLIAATTPSVSELQDALGDEPSLLVKSGIADVIAGRKPSVGEVNQLSASLLSAEPATRLEVAKLLGRTRPETARTALQSVVESRTELAEIRAAAAISLGRAGSDATAAFTTLSNATDLAPALRRAVLRGLAISGADGVRDLAARAESASESERDAAIAALADASASGEAALLALLEASSEDRQGRRLRLRLGRAADRRAVRRREPGDRGRKSREPEPTRSSSPTRSTGSATEARSRRPSPGKPDDGHVLDRRRQPVHGRSEASAGRTTPNGNLKDDGTKTYKFDYRNHPRRGEAEVFERGDRDLPVRRPRAPGRKGRRGRSGDAVRPVGAVETIEEFDGSNVLFPAGALRLRRRASTGRGRWTGRTRPTSDGDSNTTEVLRFLIYHQNALGSVSELSAPTGAVVEWVTYDVYGAAAIVDRTGTSVTSSAVGNPFLFTGLGVGRRDRALPLPREGV